MPSSAMMETSTERPSNSTTLAARGCCVCCCSSCCLVNKNKHKSIRSQSEQQQTHIHDFPFSSHHTIIFCACLLSKSKCCVRTKKKHQSATTGIPKSINQSINQSIKPTKSLSTVAQPLASSPKWCKQCNFISKTRTVQWQPDTLGALRSPPSLPSLL